MNAISKSAIVGKHNVEKTRTVVSPEEPEVLDGGVYLEKMRPNCYSPGKTLVLQTPLFDVLRAPCYQRRKPPALIAAPTTSTSIDDAEVLSFLAYDPCPGTPTPTAVLRTQSAKSCLNTNCVPNPPRGGHTSLPRFGPCVSYAASE